MKELIIYLVAFVFAFFFQPSTGSASTIDILGIEAEESVICIQELRQLTLSDSLVERYVDEYAKSGRRETVKILQRGIQLFPLFECQLISKGLPRGLKYIPMIESGLRQKARSYAGAFGLWQFTPRTARYYGLIVSDTLDQRQDVVLASQAASSFLADLKEDFCDWRLVLAAYNCGPGRVKKAIRQAKSDQYDSIKKFLPGQTQHYVAKFMAATYIANHYASYGIQPFLRSSDKSETGSGLVRIHSKCEINAGFDQRSEPTIPSGLVPFNRIRLATYWSVEAPGAIVNPFKRNKSQKPLLHSAYFMHKPTISPLIQELPVTSIPPFGLGNLLLPAYLRHPPTNEVKYIS